MEASKTYIIQMALTIIKVFFCAQDLMRVLQ